MTKKIVQNPFIQFVAFTLLLVLLVAAVSV